MHASATASRASSHATGPSDATDCGRQSSAESSGHSSWPPSGNATNRSARPTSRSRAGATTIPRTSAPPRPQCAAPASARRFTMTAGSRRGCRRRPKWPASMRGSTVCAKRSAGSWKPKAGSRKPAAGSRKPAAGSQQRSADQRRLGDRCLDRGEEHVVCAARQALPRQRREARHLGDWLQASSAQAQHPDDAAGRVDDDATEGHTAGEDAVVRGRRAARAPGPRWYPRRAPSPQASRQRR